MLHEFENIRVCIFKASNVEAYNLLIEQFPTFLNNLSYNQCLSLREFSKEFPGLNESSGKKKKVQMSMKTCLLHCPHTVSPTIVAKSSIKKSRLILFILAFPTFILLFTLLSPFIVPLLLQGTSNSWNTV